MAARENAEDTKTTEEDIVETGARLKESPKKNHWLDLQSKRARLHYQQEMKQNFCICSYTRKLRFIHELCDTIAK
jgi:hypothetical protein